MLWTTWHGILAHKFRLLATALAVTLGVALTAGTFILTDTVTKTFDDLFANAYGKTDAVVRAVKAFEGPQNTGDQRGRVDAAVVPAVSRLPGVAAAEGDVAGFARIVGKNGKALGNPNGAPTLGMGWPTVTKLNPWTVVAGCGPTTNTEVAIDAKSARDGGYRVGDTARILVQGPPQRMTVVGILKLGSADSPGGATVAVFTTPTAQRLIGEPGKYDQISVLAAKGVSQSQLVSRISPVIPKGTEAVTGAQVVKEDQNLMHKSLSFVTTFMLVFAVVALLVGGFMIFNTFAITVAQRTRENGLLRALGASRRQVLVAVLVEALVIGVLASIIGLGLGFVVAVGLKALMRGVGIDIPAGGTVFAARTVLVSLAVGIVVTVLSALSPARKAAKVPPVAAMSDAVVGSTGYGSVQRVIVGALVLVASTTTLLVGLFTNLDRKVLVVGAGAVGVFFGVSILGRTISLPLSRFIGWPLPRLRGVTGALARENAMRNPKRTAASASALMIGVGLVGFITIFVTSAKASFDSILDANFTGDLEVSSQAGLMGGMDPAVQTHIAALPGVKSATAVRLGSALISGKAQVVGAADPATAFDIIQVDPVKGTASDLGANGIAVYKDVAKEKNLTIGSTVPVVFKDTGAKQMRVAFIYGRNQAIGNWFLGDAAYNANFANRYLNAVYVKDAPGADTGVVRAAVERVAAAYPGVEVWDQQGIKDAQAKPLNQMLALVYVLLALAVFIALLGIANTLALSILERTRELGLLRAVGMTRAQLRSMIRWESVIIALQGTLLGLVIGVFFGWAMVTSLQGAGISVFRVPFGSLAAVVVIAAVAGMVAAVPPGRRAARLDVLKAVVSE